MSFMRKLGHIDRRIIFVTVFLAGALPLIFPFTLPVAVKPETKRFFDTVDALEAGDRVLLAMDYSPETRPEIDPMSEAVLRHCFFKKIRVVGMVDIIQNIPIGEQVMRRIGDEMGAVYGEDYVYLGFKPEPRALLITMSEEIRKAFPVDFYQTPLDDLPMMKGIHNFDDLELAAVSSADDVSLEWLLTANTRFGVRVVMGISSNFYPSFMPYIESGQILGAMGGMKGCAEYEAMLETAGAVEGLGDATRGMATQSSVHLLIIGYILLGNIGYFALRGKRGGALRGKRGGGDSGKRGGPPRPSRGKGASTDSRKGSRGGARKDSSAEPREGGGP